MKPPKLSYGLGWLQDMKPRIWKARAAGFNNLEKILAKDLQTLSGMNVAL